MNELERDTFERSWVRCFRVRCVMPLAHICVGLYNLDAGLGRSVVWGVQF